MRRRQLPSRTLLAILGILVLQSACTGDRTIGGPDAGGSSPTAVLGVMFGNTSTVPTFVLTNKGGGSYEGSFSFSGAQPATVTVKSNLGGSATKAVKRN